MQLDCQRFISASLICAERRDGPRREISICLSNDIGIPRNSRTQSEGHHKPTSQVHSAAVSATKFRTPESAVSSWLTKIVRFPSSGKTSGAGHETLRNQESSMLRCVHNYRTNVPYSDKVQIQTGIRSFLLNELFIRGFISQVETWNRFMKLFTWRTNQADDSEN